MAPTQILETRASLQTETMLRRIRPTNLACKTSLLTRRTAVGSALGNSSHISYFSSAITMTLFTLHFNLGTRTSILMW